MVNYINIKTIYILLLLSTIIGCEKPIEEPASDCSTIEVNIECERPSVSPINKIYSILDTHTTNGIEIMNLFLDGCFDKTGGLNKINEVKSYITHNGDTPTIVDTLYSIPVIIHELNHSISGRFTDESSNQCESLNFNKEWIDNQTEISIAKKKLFPIKEIYDSLIPMVKNNNLYTDQYIQQQNALQTYGAYACLNEFSSYYQGILTAFELYPVYNELFLASNDRKYLDHYITYIDNEIGAYYSFKYFLTLYIHYAKDNHVADYNDIINNTNFWIAYKIVNKKYEKFIVDYKSLLESDEYLSSISYFEQNYNETYQVIEEEIERLK